MVALAGCGSVSDPHSSWVEPMPASSAPSGTPVMPASHAMTMTPASAAASKWYSQWLKAMGALAHPDAGAATEDPGMAGAAAAQDPQAQSSNDSGTSDHTAGDDNTGNGAVTPPSKPKPPAANAGACVKAKQLWFDDFETGDYRRWTSQTYNNEWGDDCQSNALSTETAHSPTRSQRSEIVCQYPADSVQRGYGGIQMSGDDVVPAYTNTGVGLDAPNGVVTVMWMRLDSPTVFENGKWVNFWTVSGSCDYTDEVMTLGLEDNTGRLSAAHYASGGGGTRTFEPDAQPLPRGQWTRITVYVNYYDKVMHVWQDGKSLEHVTFNRALNTMCQFHWGLYASANNDNVVLFEDDKSMWKLGERWTDFDKEPYFGGDVQACTQ
jgi:hypothetical protein